MSMDAETLPITSHNRISSRGLCYFARDFVVINALLCIFFCFLACEPSFVISLPEQLRGNDPCGPSKENYGSPLSEVIMLNDLNARENPEVLPAHGNVCANSELFCFPSTLRGISSERYNNVEVTSVAESFNDHVLPEVGASQSSKCASNSCWSSDRGMSILVNGRTVVCSLSSGKSMGEFSYIRGNSSTASQNEISSCRGPLHNHNSATFSMEEVEMLKSGPDVEISPPVLDWGETYMYFPSLAFVTVTNNWKDKILRVYQPISLDGQFFPCNFTEAALGPGEILSICFVFLPKSLGSSSTHLILQTSSGGFLVQAKGYAADSPYGIQPLLGLNVSSYGIWRNNLSLSNPFDESIRVEELTIWVSMGKDARQLEATCSLQEFNGADDIGVVVKDWFLVRTDPVESVLQMAVRLHRNWEVSAQSSENIVELDFTFSAVGAVLGALCMQLTRLSQNTADIIVIPIEAEIGSSSRMNDDTDRFITVSLESLASSEPARGSVAISLRNSGRSVVTVHEISETAGSGLFHIKYIEGLLLFPGSVTQVAIVTCAHYDDESREFAREMSDVAEKCKLLVQTNDSTSRIEIPCYDIMHLYRGGNNQFDDSKHRGNDVGCGDEHSASVDRTTSSPKVTGTADSDELVLRNWKSLGSDAESSVLDDVEVFFPVIAVGTHHSKWIIVQNPSRQPVIMQLLLNSGEIINNCRVKIDGLSELVYSGKSLISKSAVRIRDGFSLAENAITEAIVQPFDKVSLGPLIFHPSQRCEWRSSVLVRNNLSGVEWLPVRGLGGMQALTISESAKPAREIEFDLESPDSSDTFDPNLTSTQPCSRPLMKVLRIMNSGDLTLEVRSIKVSGTDCRLDGFVVHNCSHFGLRPGESTELKISYQSKYSAPLVRRDLELALASGIFVLPLRATIPVKVIGECRRSIFWSRAKKIFAAALVAAPCAFFVFCCLYPQALGFCAPYCFCKSDGESFQATTHRVVKSSKAQYSKKYGKFTSSTKAKRHLPSIAIDEKALLLSPDDDDNVRSEEYGIRIQRVDVQSRAEIPGTVLATPEKPAEEEESPANMGDAENGAAEEPTLPGNLTVCIGKEKGRRRRKRKGADFGLSALIEVSSSHSGNSTPSSPLSPVSSFPPTPQRVWPRPNDVEQSLETRLPKPRKPVPVKSLYSPKRITLDQPAVPPPPARPRTALKHVLLPSATFPSSSHLLPSRARIAPHAKATGSRLCSERAPTAGENAKKAAAGRKEFTYDIWGNHFSAIVLTGKGRRREDDNSVRISCGVVDIDYSDNSFFARGPPVLLTNVQPEPSSYAENT